MSGQLIKESTKPNRNLSLWRKLCSFGMLVPIVYLSHVIVGSILWKGYSQLQQPISDLTSAAAPNRVLLNNIMNVCGLFSLIFFISVFIYLRNVRYKTIKSGTILLIIFELISISYLFFPEDLMGAELTFIGVMHIIVTALIVPVIIAAPILLGIGFKKLKGFEKFGIYSIVTSIIIFITGGVTAYIMANKLSYFGLWERFNMGSIYLWIFLLGYKLFTTDLEVTE